MKTAKVALIFALIIAQYFVAGCGQKTEETVELTAPATEQAGVDLALDKNTPLPPPTSDVPLTTSTSTPAPIDFSANDRPLNDKGRAMSDLEWLNQIVMEHAMMQSASADAVGLPAGKKFNDPDEESAARLAAMAERQKDAVLRDLSDLVKAGRLKSIPAAPAGKQYVLDQKTGMVVMVDQK